MSKFLPVFTGGLLRNNEFVIPLENFIFESEKELKKANEMNPFVEFFPFSVIFSRVLEINGGFDGVEVSIGGEKLYCISGEIYDSVAGSYNSTYSKVL